MIQHLRPLESLMTCITLVGYNNNRGKNKNLKAAVEYICAWTQMKTSFFCHFAVI